MGNLIVTEPTTRLIRIWKNYGGKKSGSTTNVKAFDNFDDNNNTGNFYANNEDEPIGYAEYVERVSEQEFIDALGLVDLPKAQESIEEELEDPVNRPAHYTDSKIEVIEIIEDRNLSFTEGNVIKYLLRYKKKNGLEDLLKSQWYLNRLIENYKKENGEV